MSTPSRAQTPPKAPGAAGGGKGLPPQAPAGKGTPARSGTPTAAAAPPAAASGGGGNKASPPRNSPTPAGAKGSPPPPAPPSAKGSPTPAAGGGGKTSPAPAAAGGKTNSPAPPAAAGKTSPNPATAGKTSPTPGAAAKGASPPRTSPTPQGGKGAPPSPTAASKSGGSPPPPAAPGGKATSPAPNVGGKTSPAPNVGGKTSPVPNAGGKTSPAPGATTGKASPAPSATSPAPSAGGKSNPTPTEAENAATPPARRKSPAKGKPAAASSKEPPPAAATTAATDAAGAVTPAKPTTAADVPPSATPAGSAPAASPVPSAPPATAASPFLTPPPQMSPVPGGSVSQQPAGSMRRSVASPRRQTAAAPRLTQAPLDRDPRSGLPLIHFPADRKKTFAHIGDDILLHFFDDCDRISSKGKPLRRIVLITDQTLFVCEENGGLTRCVQVSKISQVNVATDSFEMAIVIPAEYDIILRFDRRSQYDDVLSILRAVHKRMVNTDLNVWQVKDVRPNQYRMERPPGFQLQRIPQRSRANLAKALESIDANDRERRMAIKRVQDQLEYEHRQEVLDKQQEMNVVQAKLDEAYARQRQQIDELEKLRLTYSKCQRRVEEIDAQYGGTSSPNSLDQLMNKDAKIRELNEVVEALNASVSKADEERKRIERLRRAGDFVQREIDFVEVSSGPRMRGRSLHHQGLIEVLQRQLLEKQRQLAALNAKHVTHQRSTIDLHKKEELLRELEQTIAATAGANGMEFSRGTDPAQVYSSAASQSFEELLRAGQQQQQQQNAADYGSPMSQSRNRDMFGSPGTLMSDINRARRGGGGDGGDEVLLGRGALSQPKSFVSTEIAEFRVPADEADFVVDPRTGLRFVDLDGPFVEKFPSLQGAILFFFAVGAKENKRGHSQKRVLIVSDQVVFQCSTNGAIHRTFEIKHIREFIRDRENQIAMIVEGLNEYDLFMKFKDPDACQLLLNVIQKTSAYNKRDPPLLVKEVEHIRSSDLRLEKPPTWEYVDRRAKPRHGLYRALQNLGKASVSERQRATNLQDELYRDITNRIREELMPEVQLRRERESVKLRQMLVTIQARLQEQQLEARNLLREIQTHKCSISAVSFKESNPAQADAQGMYWIPTDPVVMESELEILHVQFNENFVVTSHANGFLNVWDIASADLIRTLKINGHTASVHTFYFDTHHILSGGMDSTLRLWHVMQPTPLRVVLKAHQGGVTCVQFDDKIAVSSGTDAVLHVWDRSTLKHLHSLVGHKTSVVAFKMDKKGSILASAEWGWLFIWDVTKGVVVKTLRDDNGGIRCLDICGTRVLTGGTGGALTLWNRSTGEAESVGEGHADDVHCVSLQGDYAVSSSADGTVRMWSIREGFAACSLGVFHECFPQEVKSFHYVANRFVAGEGTTLKCWTR